MKSYFTMWACCLALVQAALAGEAGTAMIEQRAQSFTIGLNGSVADVTPLFGPVREAEWAPDWSPRFIHPAQGVQREGVVFTTTSGDGRETLVAHNIRPWKRQGGVRSDNAGIHG